MCHSALNSFFDHVYVINLDRRRDRKVTVQQKLKRKGIAFTFFNAVDGKDMVEISGLGGGAGYLKSYLNLLRDARARGYEKILCLDDDILFHKDFDAQLERFLESIGREWKLLWLGATQHTWTDEIKVSLQGATYYHPDRTDGSFALGIHSSVFQELIVLISQSQRPLDSGVLHELYSKDREHCFVAFPNIIVADVNDSDILSARDQFELAEKVHWNMKDYEYPFIPEMVSVIMPVYNGQETVEKSIMSVLNQSYSNIELIVSDDGSTDSTVDIVQRLMNKVGTIKLIRNEKNKGCYYARNQAVRQSEGKYIAIQDADDISLTNRISTQLLPMVKDNAKFTIGHIYRSRIGMQEFDLAHETELLKMVRNRQVNSAKYEDQAILGFNTTMYERTLFEDFGLFWEKKFASDAEFHERILFKCGNMLLEEGENIHTLLKEIDQIDGLYRRIDEVLVVSAKMTETNISNKYNSAEKLAIQRTWRDNFLSGRPDDYPLLPLRRSASDNVPTDADKLKTSLTLTKKILEAVRNRNKKLEDDLAWYARTYDHLPKWLLKIGSIFRRF